MCYIYFININKYCTPKHLEGFAQVCIHQHRGDRRKQDLHNKDQELWAGTFLYELHCCEVSDPSPDPAKREDAK